MQSSEMKRDTQTFEAFQVLNQLSKVGNLVKCLFSTFVGTLGRVFGHSLPTRLAREESRSLASSFPPGWMAI